MKWKSFYKNKKGDLHIATLEASNKKDLKIESNELLSKLKTIDEGFYLVKVEKQEVFVLTSI